jgi:rRNA maturation endonuclease Nob1
MRQIIECPNCFRMFRDDDDTGRCPKCGHDNRDEETLEHTEHLRKVTW